MFDHSIKVPRLYKTAAKVLKEFQVNKGSVKNLVYEAKHQNVKGLYALVVETVKKRNEIDNLFRRSQILIKEARLDPDLAKILITELLWGKKRLAGESKPVKTVLAYEQIFKAHLPDIEAKSSRNGHVAQVQKPRYVRVNALVTTTDKAVNAFRDEEWKLIRFTQTDNYEKFLETARSLDVDDFMVDIHIPDLLLFHPKTQFYNHDAYRDGEIILQDKASCLPVHILNPQQGSTVLDMCAAPGMKTTQIAAVINNQGTVYAVEFDKKRMEVLENMVESSGATCVKTINRDVLTITDQECPNVEYILVDPSCSGSGIVDRLDLDDDVPKYQQERLTKLAGFQIKILRHALTRFPNAKRVVYSTCSLNIEENEDVVRQVLETCTTFKLVPAKNFLNGVWLNYGTPDYGEIGEFCIYTRPEVDLTNGFFVAVFERLEEGEENPFLNKNAYKKDRNKPRSKQQNSIEKHNEKNMARNQDHENGNKKNKKRKQRKELHCNDDYIPQVDDAFEDNGELNFHDKTENEEDCNELKETVLKSSKKKKNKKKKHPKDIVREISVNANNLDNENANNQVEEIIHKNKKHKKGKSKITEEINTIESTKEKSCEGSEEKVKNKKINKKRKLEDLEDSVNLEYVNAHYASEETDCQVPRNRKKKNNKQSRNENTSEKSCDRSEEKVINKKKNKKRKLKEVEDSVNIGDENAGINEEEIDSVCVSEETEYQVPRKKKKNKIKPKCGNGKVVDAEDPNQGIISVYTL